MKEGSAQVIDVRTKEEYQSGHIPHVPLRTMQELPDWISELDPQKSYVFVCRSGARSQRVALYLHQNGFDHVANLNGGMMGWDGSVVTES